MQRSKILARHASDNFRYQFKCTKVRKDSDIMLGFSFAYYNFFYALLWCYSHCVMERFVKIPAHKQPTFLQITERSKLCDHIFISMFDNIAYCDDFDAYNNRLNLQDEKITP